MLTASSRLALVLATGLVISAVGCGGDELVLPGTTEAAKIALAGGEGQTAPAGGELKQPAVVLVLDGQDRPVEGQKVTFALPNGGHVTPASAVTDARGYASTRWTLGASAGAQRLRAQVDGADQLSVTLGATALTGSGAAFAIVSGDDQTGSVGSALGDSLVVRVADDLGNPVAGIAVEWNADNGAVSPATTVTGADGLAAAERVLGASAGPQSATATAQLSEPATVTFHHVAEAAAPTALLGVSGDAQSAPAGFAVSDSLLIRLVDGNGNGVGGKAITWIVATGGGSVSHVNTQTSPQGYASTRWTLGSSAGPNLLNAVFSGVPSVPFTATATADLPSRMDRVSGDAQTGTVGSALPQPLAVKVTDGNGNPVNGVPVSWTATGGSVSAPVTATGDDGIARVTRTLGSAPGPYATVATVAGLDGSPVSFTATANAGGAARIVITQQPSATAASGVAIGLQPAIRLEDALGNPAAQGGVAVTVSVVGGADLGGTATRNTSGAGTVSFSGLSLGGAVGTYNLAFTAPGLEGAQSSAIVLAAGPAARLALLQQPAATAQSGVALSTQPTVQVTDAAGNPVSVSARAISASISDGDPALVSGGVKLTNAQGQAAFTAIALSGASGPRTLLFSSSGLVSVESNTISLGAGGAATLTKIAGDGRSAAAGGNVAPAPSVKLTDAAGNPVAGTTVSFAVVMGGGSVTGATVATDANGVATVGSWTLGQTAGSDNNTLTASAPGVASVTFTASAAAGSPAELRFLAEPTDVPAGQTMTPAVRVGVVDAYGNLVTSASRTVTVALVADPAAGATLGGTTSISVAMGVATFSDLSVDIAGSGYALSASAAALPSATSSTFEVTP